MKIVLKILAGLLAVIVLAVGVLFVLSHRPSAGRSHMTIAIARPPAQVFPWLVEPNRLTQWVEWLVEVRVEPGAEQKAGRRSVWVMADPNMKDKMLLDAQLLELDAPRRMRGSVQVPKMFHGEVTWTLEAKDGGTLVTYDTNFGYDNALFSLLEPLVTPQARKKQESDLQRLKSRVESGALASVR
jgi:uncharacterized protein YndB with AHSA1/START domain